MASLTKDQENRDDKMAGYAFGEEQPKENAELGHVSLSDLPARHQRRVAGGALDVP